MIQIKSLELNNVLHTYKKIYKIYPNYKFTKKSTNKVFPIEKIYFNHDTVLPVVNCPCGRDKNCIVFKRSIKEWVQEDEVFKVNNLPLRVNCWKPYTKEQYKAMKTIY